MPVQGMDFENIERALKMVRKDADKRALFMYGTLCAIVFIVFFFFHFTFGAPESRAIPGSFSVGRQATDDDIAYQLKESGLTRFAWTFKTVLALRGLSGEIAPGGYAVAKTMNAWEIVTALTTPNQTWVVIPEGLRKEEIGKILGDKLSWTAQERGQWLEESTTKNWSVAPPEKDSDYAEGVYFPDTYLVPLDEGPDEAAKRLQAQFQSVLAPLAPAASAQNIKWTTVVKMASIIQREAAGPGDMPLIAGILWNRLDEGMGLNVDATVQYARGNRGKGYWAPISSADKKINSPYNTYIHRGLPPGPIANPGADALKAVLYPERTKCLYYLHDAEGDIHCSATYDGHLDNIEKYY